MFDVTLVLTGILLTVTAVAAAEYYRQLRRAQKEYEKARDAIDDIILSFNRQFRRESEKLEMAAYKVEAVSARSNEALEKSREVERKLLNLEPKIAPILQGHEKTFTRLDEIEGKLCDTVASQQTLTARVSGIEEKAQKLQIIAEPSVEAVIPIRRDKALAPLTPTELTALEMLATEGSKTALEIKERIKLSREHTARLMKKLYEAGYLERDASKIPFKYSVKKEMERLLKKAEGETA
jgi:DNA-binding MarR family transcriptional regulator